MYKATEQTGSRVGSGATLTRRGGVIVSLANPSWT